MDDAIENRDTPAKQADSFRKVCPKFFLGERTWSNFMDYFTENSLNYPNITPRVMKSILYCSMQGDAATLCSPDYNPRNPGFIEMNLVEYAKELGELFEPASETEQMKLEFEQRYQRSGEHPNLYYRDKKNLFTRAYSQGTQDWTYFYNKVISGLINQEMKNGLRLLTPDPVTDTEQFRKNLMKMATIVRRKYMDGEITEAEALGAEAHASVVSYQRSRPMEVSLGKASIKQEAVYALSGKKGQGNGKCYHCHSKEHFIGQCPRRAAGLAPTVQTVQTGFTSESINAAYTPKPVTGRKKFHWKNRNTQFNHGDNPGRGGKLVDRKIIAYLVEDENGDHVLETADPEEGDADAQGEDPGIAAIAEGVNTLHMKDYQEADYSEGDYLPGAFLGM